MKIRLENIGYFYSQNIPQSRQVLREINLQISDGEFVGLVGPTGSGKTTLLQQFTGLLKPTTGTIYVDNENIWGKNYSLTELRKKIGVVFQFPENQLFEDSVAADVAFGPQKLKLPTSEINDRVKQALEYVGMDYEKIKNRVPNHLSEGEKRRVALAGVLAMAPRMLILDEPTAGLDPKGTKLIVQILHRLNREGTTIFLITHNMDIVFQLVNRILVLNKGKLIYDGSRDDLICREDIIKKAKLAIPRIVRLAKYLYNKHILTDWKIFTNENLKKLIKTTKESG